MEVFRPRASEMALAVERSTWTAPFVVTTWRWQRLHAVLSTVETRSLSGQTWLQVQQ
jgi:hypothetical protein